MRDSIVKKKKKSFGKDFCIRMNEKSIWSFWLGCNCCAPIRPCLYGSSLFLKLFSPLFLLNCYAYRQRAHVCVWPGGSSSARAFELMRESFFFFELFFPL
jgi:hypothetical protein